MRSRWFPWLLAGSVCVLVLAESSSGAPSVCLRAVAVGCPPTLNLDLDARVSPRSLPKKKPALVGLRIGARVRTSDGTQPPALREAIFDVDKDMDVDVSGLPACRDRGPRIPVGRGGGLRRAEKACGDAIVGSGRVWILIGFPGQVPMQPSSKVTLFNGGVRDGAIVLFALTEIKVPKPRTLAARIEVKRIERGRYGWQANVKVPVIAGGRGSLADLSLRLRRRFFSRGTRKSFLSARCRDGTLRIRAPKILFRNEADKPGVAPRTVFKGNLVVPCQPKQP